jgi:hypothetical protein
MNPSNFLHSIEGRSKNLLRIIINQQIKILRLTVRLAGLQKHLLDFDKKYANYDEEEGTYKKYLLYNMYPIVSNTTTLTASLQPRFDLFINYNNVDDELGTHHDPAKYKYVGILPAIFSCKRG